MSGQLQFDAQVPCDRCGRFGAYLFDGDRLCGACYESRGSCCPEFAADDLWERDATGTPRPECADPRKR